MTMSSFLNLLFKPMPNLFPKNWSAPTICLGASNSWSLSGLTMSTGLFPISHSIPLNLIPGSNSLDLACENNTSSYPYTTLSLHNNDSIALPLSMSPLESNIDIISYQEPTNPDPQAPPLEQPERNIIIRSKTGNLKPKYFFGFKMFYYTHHLFHCLTSI